MHSLHSPDAPSARKSRVLSLTSPPSGVPFPGLPSVIICRFFGNSIRVISCRRHTTRRAGVLKGIPNLPGKKRGAGAGAKKGGEGAASVERGNFTARDFTAIFNASARLGDGDSLIWDVQRLRAREWEHLETSEPRGRRRATSNASGRRKERPGTGTFMAEAVNSLFYARLFISAARARHSCSSVRASGRADERASGTRVSR